MLKVNGVKFDDYTEDLDFKEHVWTQVCKECLENHSISEMENAEVETFGSGICGVQGCENESDHYVDFEFEFKP